MIHLTLREHVDEFGRRLDRIGAASRSLRELSADLADGHAADLLNALVVVDRELMLASHDLDALRERATREARSMGPTGDRIDALE